MDVNAIRGTQAVTSRMRDPGVVARLRVGLDRCVRVDRASPENRRHGVGGGRVIDAGQLAQLDRDPSLLGGLTSCPGLEGLARIEVAGRQIPRSEPGLHGATQEQHLEGIVDASAPAAPRRRASGWRTSASRIGRRSGAAPRGRRSAGMPGPIRLMSGSSRGGQAGINVHRRVDNLWTTQPMRRRVVEKGDCGPDRPGPILRSSRRGSQRHRRLHQRSGGGSFGTFRCAGELRCRGRAGGAARHRPSPRRDHGPARTRARRTCRTGDRPRRRGRARCTRAR